MAVFAQNSHSTKQVFGPFDGSSFSETLDLYLDYKNLSAVPTYNGGSNWNGYAIYGFDGADKIFAGHGDDNIYGGYGSDSIQSYYGYNFIDGGPNSDTLDYSWFGQDTSIDNNLGVDADLAAGDTFAREAISGLRFNDEFVSIENLRGSNFNDILAGNSLNNVIRGGIGNDQIYGRSGHDSLYGGSNADYISGGNGDDRLFGESGDDTLVGGIGADDLKGGLGADKFVYSSVADSTRDLLSQDLITDFSQFDGDRIDLHLLTGTVIDFIGISPFSADGFNFPEVRYFRDGGGDTIVRVDTDGNGVTNVEITLSGNYTLTGSDFIL